MVCPDLKETWAQQVANELRDEIYLKMCSFIVCVLYLLTSGEKGDTGVIGEKGQPGPIGPMGPSGNVGEPGPRGLQGTVLKFLS